MKVKNKRLVHLRYTLKNEKGEVVEDTMNRKSITYVHGAGTILPELENCLIGLKIGDKTTIFISPEQGFKNMDSQYYCDVVIDDVRLATQQEIEVSSSIKKSDADCGPGCFC